MWISRCNAEWIGFTFCRILDRPYAFKAQRVKAAGGHIRVSGGKRARGSKSDPRDQWDHGGSLILGEKLVIFLGSKIFWMQSPMNSLCFFGGQGCPCALVLLRQEWFATLFLDIRALRRTDLFDGVAVKHHMINAVHVTEAQKHCLRMLTLLDKLINWESFMLFHHFSTFFNRKCVYIGGSFPSNDVRLLETCRLTRSLGLAIGEDSGIIAEPQVEHMQCGENLIHWITCIIYLHV